MFNPLSYKGMSEIIKKSDCLAEVSISYKTKVKPSDRLHIKKSEDAYSILKSIWDGDKIEYVEEFIILLLNRTNKVLGWAKISQGGTTGTVVDAKVVFQLALNANACSIILSHNHPSGNTKPSDTDIALTKKLKDGAKVLDLQVLDHVIITEDAYFSFADEGLM